MSDSYYGHCPKCGGQMFTNHACPSDPAQGVKRYDPETRHDGLYAAMKESRDGDYVLYSDYASLSAQLAEEKGTSAELVKMVSEYKKQRNEYRGLYKAEMDIRKAAESQLSAAREALGAIAEALKEPAGGEYWTARKLLDKYGIFHDDLSGERVLNALALAALNGGPLTNKEKGD